MAKNLSTFMQHIVAPTHYREKVYTINVSGQLVDGSARDNAFSHENVRVKEPYARTMKNLNLKMWGSGAATGGACCCMSGTAGESGSRIIYTPKDPIPNTDYLFFQLMTNACCQPPSMPGGICHDCFCLCRPSGSGWSAVVCSGCRGESSCFWHTASCCNYGSLWYMCDPGTTVLTATLGEPGVSAYDNTGERDKSTIGYDCTICMRARVGSFEAGSCINKSVTGIWGSNQFAAIPFKSSHYTTGTHWINAYSYCVQELGGWTHTQNGMYYHGANANKNYWFDGIGAMNTTVSSGACCCGGYGGSGSARITWEV